MIRMATGWVWGGYPRVSGFRVSGLGFDFRPRFCGFGYPKYFGFGADSQLYPRSCIGARNKSAQQKPINNPRCITHPSSPTFPHPHTSCPSLPAAAARRAPQRPPGRQAGRPRAPASVHPGLQAPASTGTSRPRQALAPSARPPFLPAAAARRPPTAPSRTPASRAPGPSERRR